MFALWWVFILYEVSIPKDSALLWLCGNLFPCALRVWGTSKLLERPLFQDICFIIYGVWTWILWSFCWEILPPRNPIPRSWHLWHFYSWLADTLIHAKALHVIILQNKQFFTRFSLNWSRTYFACSLHNSHISCMNNVGIVLIFRNSNFSWNTEINRLIADDKQ